MTLPRVIELDRTCMAFPAQWEGRIADGRQVYIRYRNGWLSASVGTTEGQRPHRQAVGLASKPRGLTP